MRRTARRRDAAGGVNRDRAADVAHARRLAHLLRFRVGEIDGESVDGIEGPHVSRAGLGGGAQNVNLLHQPRRPRGRDDVAMRLRSEKGRNDEERENQEFFHNGRGIPYQISGRGAPACVRVRAPARTRQD